MNEQKPAECSKPKISTIVITGGPCAGKTTGMSWIRQVFSLKGYKTIFVPECATELISAGVAKDDSFSLFDFQSALIDLQNKRERIYRNAAASMNHDKILIVCDRGMMDSEAYLGKVDFERILDNLRINPAEINSRYDGIFHLCTAAKGVRDNYTTANNAARSENADEAVQVDDSLIEVWKDHPYHRIIGSKDGFHKKMEQLIREIAELLDEDIENEIQLLSC